MPTCHNCDTPISATFVRVFGDNDGTLEGCVHCLSSTELTGSDGRHESPSLRH
ncbi:DUF7563 family protein [Natronococcus occultus]|uniref:Small CPxCG-related zinc finger protein n=1 Tax=Natronococcus occultus SP4 TaxID=694430 RepID=L0K034_9EURY|nr:hypothetical protein [Natronococcus occultus]AGB38662.1 hypothetical protein Natoc_2906 [Natronococcus occultus SP4]